MRYFSSLEEERKSCVNQIPWNPHKLITIIRQYDAIQIMHNNITLKLDAQRLQYIDMSVICSLKNLNPSIVMNAFDVRER